MINNRDIATAVWLVVLLVFVSTKADVRASFASLAGAFFKTKVVVPFLLFAGWLAGWVWFASVVGLWQCYLLKDTIIWGVVSGLALLTNAIRVAEVERLVRSTIRSTVEASVILGFFLNIVAFHVVIELILLPVMALLVIAPILAERDAQLARSKRLFEGLLAIASIILIFLTAIELYRQRDGLDMDELWPSWALSLWLPIVAIPFVYAFALIASYEMAFLRLGFANRQQRVSFKARVAVMLGLRGQIRDISAFAGGWARQVAEAPSFRSAFELVREFRRHREKQRQEEQERQNRLRRFAGVKGVDAEGMQLDQREFAETREALRWLATCQMGWYQNRGNRYRHDLIERIGGLSSRGLPEEHGIVMNVRSGGQAWYAWRRTITGWVFAIGAAQKPPDQWLFDGPEPPTGVPGEADGWERFGVGSSAKNW